MGIVADLSADTKRQVFLYRSFTIMESTEGWEWTHEDYSRGTPVTGTVETVFDCIDAVDAWHVEQDFGPDERKADELRYGLREEDLP